ncbi:long chain fatty alcohol oxidase [Diaporthe helianthi]|uniref:Long-chain-alcohol oxidase n=1 Tax=Diaporthe helianthi TaxID=158607 RepID=A0A2P5HLC2_DIAHE|nr:long chain fatty alcohol oxidase [Diaporthe helianthi]
MVLAAGVLAPESPALPALPPDDFWSETEWAVFNAILDAIVPAVVSKSSLVDRQGQLAVPDGDYSAVMSTARATTLQSRDEASLKAFMEDKASTHPAVREVSLRIAARLSDVQKDGLKRLLKSLSSSVGAFLLTGSCIPFHQQPPHVRESIVQAWHNSWFPSMRNVARSLVRISQVSWLMSSPTFRDVTGYPDVPVNWKPGLDFGYRFLQFPVPTPSCEPEAGSENTPATIETDVVIVGSGCGGAVCAKVLAEAGHRVVLVDKGYNFPTSMLPLPGPVASRYLFDKSVTHSADGSIGIVAGATWGGGGTVNWSVSLRTQDFVRKEWAARGLDWFDSHEYDECMDRVCERMGVATDPVVQSHRGRLLLDGSSRLGWKAGVCPQNCGGKEHSCGHCTMGCGSGEKQGPTQTWLPDAARAGAEFIEGFTVDRVLFEQVGGSKKHTTTGVVGTWTSRDSHGGIGGPTEERVSRQLVVKAKKVIVACNALFSPLLLIKSGLTNPNIGRNLYLHPCNMAGGFYPEDARPWEGGIITSYNYEFENLDGHGHGVKLETTNMTPYTCLSAMPWRSGLAFKLAALRYRHYAGFISVARDRDPGRVLMDPATGDLRIEYTPSAFDRANAIEGDIALCKIMYVTGAREINPFIHGVDPFVRDDAELQAARAAAEDAQARGCGLYQIDDPSFSAWLDKARRLGNILGNPPCSSAHQMGSCRMSASEEDGVVDAFGRVWATEGLYVADSSVFPSASGVNPMITVMAIADRIARAVHRDLEGQKL